MGLTAKQEAFAQAVARGATNSDAYRAVYSHENCTDKSVHEMSSTIAANLKVASRIKELRDKATEKVVKKLAISKEWVLDELIKVNSAAQAAEPILDHEGNPTGEYKAQLPAANRALELIGKELGMFVDRKEVRTGLLDGLAHDDLVALEEILGTTGEVHH